MKNESQNKVEEQDEEDSSDQDKDEFKVDQMFFPKEEELKKMSTLPQKASGNQNTRVKKSKEDKQIEKTTIIILKENQDKMMEYFKRQSIKQKN